MQFGQTIKDYFSLLDSGEGNRAAAMFAPHGRVSAPWDADIEPSDFIDRHLSSASNRRHRVLDVLISQENHAAAVHFEYTSQQEDGAMNPTFIGCDHFQFTPDGKIQTLSVYCHAKEPSG